MNEIDKTVTVNITTNSTRRESDLVISVRAYALKEYNFNIDMVYTGDSDTAGYHELKILNELPQHMNGFCVYLQNAKKLREYIRSVIPEGDNCVMFIGFGAI